MLSAAVLCPMFTDCFCKQLFDRDNKLRPGDFFVELESQHGLRVKKSAKVATIKGKTNLCNAEAYNFHAN